MFARVEPSYLVPILHHSHFKMKPLEQKKKKEKNPRQSQDGTMAVKDTTFRCLSHCSDAFGSAVEQTQTLNNRKKKTQVKSVNT